MYSEFTEFRNRTVETLSREAGRDFRCWYAAGGLPEKVVTDGGLDGDNLTDPPLKMMLVESLAGDALESYLANKLGLDKGVDYVRHANGIRGGARYFDIYTDTAIAKIFARAEELGNGAAAGRLHDQGTPYAGR